MGKQGELKERLATLDEIGGIMNAMKNLALLETQKLAVFQSTQRRTLASIEAAAQDFLGFYSYISSLPDALQQIWIVIGSERGFCGDFNDALVEYLNVSAPKEGTLLLVVGSRLETKLHQDARIAAFVKSHSVVEEVQTTLLHLVEMLNKMQQLEPARIACIKALYYDDESGQIMLRQLLPLEIPKLEPAYAYPPLLNLEPERVLSHLTDQYLYAALHEVFYSSLMVENHMRLEHMNRAIHRLEKDVTGLRLRYNRLRQEEIIEEIEIIMLSAEALAATDESGSKTT
jgi:F-type H+-transporting ATPase subunit gamma